MLLKETEARLVIATSRNFGAITSGAWKEDNIYTCGVRDGQESFVF